MSVIPDCFDHIIGLTRTQCDCFTVPADASESDSDLYLDELESLNAIQSLENCTDGDDLWDYMVNARKNAVIKFKADLNTVLLTNYKIKRPAFTGSIGRVNHTASFITSTGTYYGVRLFCADIREGTMTINKITTYFDQTGTKTVFIYDNTNTLIDTLTLNTLANQVCENVVGLELPLHSDLVTNLEYYLVYEGSSNYPKNNDIKCTCGHFKATFDTHKPYWYGQHGGFDWAKWVMVGSVVQTSLDFMNMCGTCANRMMGLILNLSFKCDANKIWCEELVDTENPMFGAMALAVQYKAGIELASWILNSGNLNRWTMINTEQLQANIVDWQNKYQEMVNFIGNNLEINSNDCYECKERVQMMKTTI